MFSRYVLFWKILPEQITFVSNFRMYVMPSLINLGWLIIWGLQHRHVCLLVFLHFWVRNLCFVIIACQRMLIIYFSLCKVKSDHISSYLLSGCMFFLLLLLSFLVVNYSHIIWYPFSLYVHSAFTIKLVIDICIMLLPASTCKWFILLYLSLWSDFFTLATSFREYVHYYMFKLLVILTHLHLQIVYFFSCFIVNE